ncbi:MAG: peptidylprolyl isomerase [Planctomycetaceae bacterium]|nr:peptidylprolyl isomerase [Planctomycetaceae bacterium]
MLHILLGLMLAGCQLRKPKDAIPVVGPPPPRYSFNNDAPSSLPLTGLADDDEGSTGDHQFVSTSVNTGREKFNDSKIVAYVNGESILASEILEPYTDKLKELKSQVPPAQFNELRRGLVERDLPIQIDNRLLIQGFKSTLKKPQQETLENAISTLFNDEIEKLKNQFQVNTDYELEVELQKKSSSLASLERAFGNRVMAAEFLKTKAGSPPQPTRQDLLAEYNKRKQDDFFRPAKLRWQQIMISYGENGGKQGAIQKLTKAAGDLRRGVDFSEIAKTYSDGPGAAKGGYWDWMQRGSLADQALEESLFTMPVGQISDVFVSETGVQIVRVLERERDHHIPFDEVQESIKDDLRKQFQETATDRVMTELREQSVIQTIFDEPQDSAPAITQTPQRQTPRQASPVGQAPQLRSAPGQTPLDQSPLDQSPFSQVSYGQEAKPQSAPAQSVVRESPFFDDEPIWAQEEEGDVFQSLTEDNPFE